MRSILNCSRESSRLYGCLSCMTLVNSSKLKVLFLELEVMFIGKQACAEKTSTLENVQVEVCDAKKQIQKLEEDLAAEKAQQEALDNSIKMERTGREVAEELAKEQKETLERKSQEIASLHKDSAHLRGALSRVESSAATLEDVSLPIDQDSMVF